GFPLRDVSEVVRAVSLAPLPKAPPIVEGVINLRGTIIPVLDIRARFKLPSKAIAPADHLVIARAKHRLVAVRVDRALGLVRWTRSEVVHTASVAPTSAYVAGPAKLHDGIVLIHALAPFLSAAEDAALSDADPADTKGRRIAALTAPHAYLPPVEQKLLRRDG